MLEDSSFSAVFCFTVYLFWWKPFSSSLLKCLWELYTTSYSMLPQYMSICLYMKVWALYKFLVDTCIKDNVDITPLTLRFYCYCREVWGWSGFFSSLQDCQLPVWQLSHKYISHVWLLATHGLQPTRLLCPWDFPSRNTGVGCHFLLQGIFPTASPALLADSLLISHWESPKASGLSLRKTGLLVKFGLFERSRDHYSSEVAAGQRPKWIWHSQLPLW